jgi:hypothetical protein
MRGWTIALTALAIATADTASWLADRADMVLVADRTPLESTIVNPVPRVQTATSRRSLAATMAEDQLAAAEVMQGPPGGEEPMDTPGDAPDETASRTEEPAQPSDETKRADIAPAEQAREREPVAPAADSPAEEAPAAPAREETPPPPPPPAPIVRQAERRDVPTEPLAIVCLAGCGERKVVYEAIPVPSRPLEAGNVIKASLSSDTSSPAVIECLAGCYDSPRTYRGTDTQAGHAMQSDPAATHADNKRQPLGTGIQRWTRSTRSGY